MTDDNRYRNTVLKQIAMSIETNRGVLEEMKDRALTPGIAWSTRNILELAVWAGYCRISEENAQRFYEDASRDAIGSLHIPEEMIKDHGRAEFKDARELLLARAAEEGISGPTSFMRVDKAAETVAFPNFGRYNMLLSKWAHPTALSVMASSEGKKVNEVFYRLGGELAAMALQAISSHFAS